MAFRKRRHLFEFNDQPWLPQVFRDGFNDTLAFTHRVFGPYGRAASVLAEWASGPPTQPEVLDLASAAGEHIGALIRAAQALDVSLPRFLLSDLYPAVDAWRRLQSEVGAQRCAFVPASLDAIAVPTDTPRYWTIFTAFHHFPEDLAEQFLSQFTQEGHGLCIAEYLERDLYNILMVILAFPVCMLAPLFARKPSAIKILLGTVIPVVPLMVTLDGIASALRTYNENEILAKIPASARQSFEVRTVTVWYSRAPLKSKLTFITRRRVSSE